MPDGTATLRLLLVEDDRALCAMRVELVIDEGYQVDVAYDAQQGLELHRGLTQRHDALIVDSRAAGRGRPRTRCVTAIVGDRGTHPAVDCAARSPTGSTDSTPGAQDYLVKPFEVPKLLARIRALVRRPNGSSTPRVAGLSLSRVTRTVSGPKMDDDGEPSEREAALLSVLMNTPGRIHTRGQFLGAVFDGINNPGVVDTHYVHYLRLGIVTTVHGTGYRLGVR